MATQFHDERFEMGRVVNRAFGAIGRNAPLFFGMAVILTIVPTLLLRIVGGTPGTAGVPIFGAIFFVSALLGLVCNVLLQAGVTKATIIDLQGGQPKFAEILRSAVGLILPLVGLTILYMLGLMVGWLLLLVPGIIVAVMWSVSVPVLVAERPGIIASFGRSRALTKGSRWSIFGLMLVAFIVLYAPLLILPLLSGGLDAETVQAASGSPASIITTILGGIAGMLLAAIIAAIYVELRFVKDGVAVGQLAAVFD